MLAVVGRTLGPPESYRLEEVPTHQPGPGQVRVAIRAAGVSFVDVLVATGGYQVKPPLPFIPGSEFAGEVDAVGQDVTELKVGDRVMAGGFGGALAQSAVVPAR